MQPALSSKVHIKSISEYLEGKSRLIFLDFDNCVYDYFFVKEHFARYCVSKKIKVFRLSCNSDLLSCPSLDFSQGFLLTNHQKLKVQRRCICLAKRVSGKRISLDKSLNIISAKHLKLLKSYTISSLIINTKQSASCLSDHTEYKNILNSLIICYLNGKCFGISEDTGFVCVNSNYAQHRAFRLGFGRPGLSLEPEILCTSPSLLYAVSLDGYKLSPNGLIEGRLLLDQKHVYKGTRRAVLPSIKHRIKHGDFNTYSSTLSSSDSEYTPPKRKTFVYLLSSPEEIEAHLILESKQIPNTFGFWSQDESLNWFCKQAEQHLENMYIVKVHPRMLSNSRYKGISSYLGILDSFREKFNLTNLDFCLTAQPSSYDLIIKSSLVFVSWSSIGYEALVLGVPVVALHPELMMYPIDSMFRQPSDLAELEYTQMTSTFPLVDPQKVYLALEAIFAPPMFSARVPAPRWYRSRLFKAFIGRTWHLWASLHLFVFGLLTKLFHLL